MKIPTLKETPIRKSYDVVIVGGSMIGSSIAWWLTNNPDFDGNVLVVERDPGYEFTSTARTGSCIRHQFSNELNVKISLFGTEFIKTFKDWVGADDPDVPEIFLHEFGYLFLATEAGVDVMRKNHAVQTACGAATQLLEPDAAAEKWPYIKLDDIVLTSHNPVGEGRFDGDAMFRSWRRAARGAGVEYITNEVVDMERNGDRIANVTLQSGETVGCDVVVNASGPRAVRTAAMAGLDIPVQPMKLTTFVFSAENPPKQTVPLIIDPAGFYVCNDGPNFRTAAVAAEGGAVDYDDLDPDYDAFESVVWPRLAERIPAFEAIRVVNAWGGHYAFNTLDHNAVIGPHPEVQNFIFANGFSGHGLQQSPAVGRGVSELITHGAFRSLDLSPLGYERITEGKPFLEKNII